MTKQVLLEKYQYFKLVHGVTIKMIGAFSEQELDFRPRPEMRSARELILHIYGMLKTFPVGIQQGKLTQETENPAIPETAEGKAAIRALQTPADCQSYAKSCFEVSEKALAELSENHLEQMIDSPFGAFPAWQYFAFAYDEHWHHRGQLYTYLRLLGKEPPMLYSYEGPGA
jgi:uncharacterized damage-inducible protein DinB